MSKELRMPHVGETLKGQYHLQKELGEGGGGKAFSGTDIEKNVPIAVKVLKFTSVHGVLQFSKEAFRMLKFAHPNLVKVIDYDSEEDTLPYLVMPLAANGSLDKEIETRRGRDEQVSLARSIAAIEQVGDALEYLHQKRIIHRDVKPHNILVPNETDFWLSDLGIAKILNPLKSLETGDFEGTRLYAAPEQFKDKAVFASDQYSLGVVAFHLLTDRYPFTGLQAEMRGKGIEVKPLTFLEAVQKLHAGESIPDVLRALDPIIMKTLAMQPEERYNSVTTFTKTLKKTADELTQEKTKGKPFQGFDMTQKHDALQQSPEPTIYRIEDIIKRCVALCHQEQYTTLLQASDQAIKLDPNNADGWFYKGVALCRFGRWEDTLEPYNRVIQLDPTHHVAIANKADSLDKLGRHEEALQGFNKALRFDPTYWFALHGKGIVLEALGRKEEAIAVYDQAIRINPQFSEAYCDKGIALNDLGRKEEAIAVYDQAIRINPQLSEAFSGKGATLCALGKYKEASSCFQQAMAANPSEQVVRFIDQVKKQYHLS